MTEYSEDRTRDMDADQSGDRAPSRNGAPNAGSFGALFGIAAAGFAAGMAANMARKMMVQAPAALQGDWVAALTAEHRIIEGLFDQLLQTRSTERARRLTLLKALKGAIGKHAFEEENVVYPALRMHSGESEARHLFAEHADVKTYLLRLETIPMRSPEWLVTLQALRAMIVKHMREEENDIFPALRTRLSPHENSRLGMMTQKEALKLA